MKQAEIFMHLKNKASNVLENVILSKENAFLELVIYQKQTIIPESLSKITIFTALYTRGYISLNLTYRFFPQTTVNQSRQLPFDRNLILTNAL